jgi:hypothetical protein
MSISPSNETKEVLSERVQTTGGVNSPRKFVLKSWIVFFTFFCFGN